MKFREKYYKGRKVFNGHNKMKIQRLYQFGLTFIRLIKAMDEELGRSVVKDLTKSRGRN